MAVSSNMSFFLSSTLAVLLFAGMQLYKQQIGGTEWMTIFGGFLGSLLFALLLIAVGNIESHLFGRQFQTKLFPEVVFCLLVAMFASSLIHRVCVTTCLIFSLVDLYYINKISQSTYAPIVTVAATTSKVKRK